MSRRLTRRSPSASPRCSLNSRSEPAWLDPEEIIELNRLIVAATDEPFSLLNRAMLESALSSPRHRYHYDDEDDAVVLAVTLLFALARNHPFEQGNKRTAFEAAVIFLEINGYEFDAPDSETLAQMIVDVITKSATEHAFTDAIRPFVVPASDVDRTIFESDAEV